MYKIKNLTLTPQGFLTFILQGASVSCKVEVRMNELKNGQPMTYVDEYTINGFPCNDSDKHLDAIHSFAKTDLIPLAEDNNFCLWSY